MQIPKQIRQASLTLIICFQLCLCLRADEQLPNIIFLLTDDQTTASIGSYGHQNVKTPNLDELAKNGIIFDRHYVTTAICMASRVNHMTGLYEFRTGTNFTRGDLPEYLWQQSYPMILRKRGYLTGFAGKFGFEIQGRKSLPEDDFDMWGGGPGQTNYQTAKNKSMKKYAESNPHSTLSYAAFADDFVKFATRNQKPFCLSISFKAPHRPVTPDPQFDSVYKDAVFPKPENYGTENGNHFAPQSKTGRQYPRFEEWGYADNFNEVMKKYHQQVFAIDVAVGQIRESLREAKIQDNTVIIFTSDNGFMCGSHGYGSKVIPYEESMRVPMIIYHPNATANGQRCDQLTGSVDIPATILELAGADVPKNVDGKSLIPLLTEPKTEIRKSLSIMNFWGPETTHFFGVVTNSWKYVYWYSEEKGMKASEELFDMANDRLESKNFVDDKDSQDALNQMRGLYQNHLYEIRDQAINQDYGKYHVIFDRTQTWDAKKQLLSKPKRPKRSGK